MVRTKSNGKRTKSTAQKHAGRFPKAEGKKKLQQFKWKKKKMLKQKGNKSIQQKGGRQAALNEHPEDFRVDIDKVFRDFTSDGSMHEYTFPADLSKPQRKYIHERCRKFGIKSKSSGSEPNRVLTISKKIKTVSEAFFELSLCKPASDAISSLLSKNPLSMEVDSANRNVYQNNTQCDISYGRLNVAMAIRVDPPISHPLQEFRQSLPVYSYRENFLQVLKTHQIILISAETGSGKTTQIPQYILESCCEQNKKCRIICTQPRRISTIAVAERVSHERGEKTGHTVGYQIKLESKLGIKTSLIYCTTGVLLRTLMSGDECCNHISHIIVDEIHERDKFSDFLLICLKECTQRYLQLRVILMSATMDMDLYKQYFNNEAYTMYIPGRTFPVTDMFLDDIIPMVGYESESMRTLRIMKENELKRDVNLSTVRMNLVKEVQIDDELRSEMDNALVECMNSGSEDYFAHIMQLILCDSVPVNTADSIYGYTPVIVAAAHGNVEVLEQLINLGGDLNHVSKDGRSPMEWANYCGQYAVINLIKASEFQTNFKQTGQIDIMSIYDKSISEDTIDYNLILAVVQYIHEKIDNQGGILIFLPGYEDIINCFDKISHSKLNMNNIKLCILHGSMQISAQHEVFKKFPNKQKIILSTNVAETSITIDGVRFVIDSGKAKQKTYDAISGTSALQTCWISMACVKQRAGRAGRTQAGICFHMFSKVRYESFLVNTTPEILRVPLHELCLQTKMLAPKGTSIAEFLSYAIEPPPIMSIKKALAALESLGALTKEEDLTPLGIHLLQLSVEPHLGKMLIYSVIFKCLDPVLTIVASLAHKDPFILPSAVTQRTSANTKRHAFSSGSLSDHMTLLVAFQLWQEAKVQHREHRFCKNNFLSPAAMEMIMLTRIQLLGQLRATGFVQVSHRENMQELNIHSDDWPLVKGIIAAGLYPNVAFANSSKLCTKTEAKVLAHASSCLKTGLFNYMSEGQSRSLWVVFEEMSKLGRIGSIKCGTAITPSTAAFMCGSFVDFQQDMQILVIDNSLMYKTNSPHILKFRRHLDNLILKKVGNSRFRFSKADEETIETLVKVLAIEDLSLGLQHPTGIGGRPKLLYKPNVEYRGSTEKHSQNSHAYNNGYQRTYYNNNNEQHQYFNNGHESGYEDQSSSANSHSQYQQSRTFKSAQHPYHPVGARQNNSLNQNIKDVSRSYQNAKPQMPPSYLNQSQPGSSKQSLNENSLINVVASKKFQFPEKSRFFFIRPTEVRNIIISVSQGTWNFAPQTEKKLFRLFNEGYFIVLLFTVRGTSYIQGVAHLLDTNGGVPNRPCRIEWLGTNSVPYENLKHLLHPKVHITEDGQETIPQIGRIICSMLMQNSTSKNVNSRPILGSMYE